MLSRREVSVESGLLLLELFLQFGESNFLIGNFGPKLRVASRQLRVSGLGGFGRFLHLQSRK